MKNNIKKIVPHRDVLLLGAVSFLNDISSEMIAPILPLLITSLGGTGLAIGLIGGVRDSLADILKFLFGYLSDRMERKKFFIYTGYSITSLARFLLLFAGSWREIGYFAGLDRLGKGIRSTPRDALIYQTMPGNVGQAFGIHRSLDTLGGIVGSCMVLFLLYSLQVSLKTIIISASSMTLLALIPLFFVQEKRVSLDEKMSDSSDNIVEKNRSILRVLIPIITLFSFSNISYMFFILKVSSSLSLNKTIIMTTFLYVLFNVSYSLVAVPVGMLSDFIGRWIVMIIAYIFFIFSLLSLAYAESFMGFVFVFLLYGIALAMVEVTQKSYISDLATQQMQATMIGLYYCMTGITMFMGNLTTGFLWNKINHSTILSLLSLFPLGAIVLLLFYRDKLRN